MLDDDLSDKFTVLQGSSVDKMFIGYDLTFLHSSQERMQETNAFNS